MKNLNLIFALTLFSCAGAEVKHAFERNPAQDQRYISFADLQSSAFGAVNLYAKTKSQTYGIQGGYAESPNCDESDSCDWSEGVGLCLKQKF